MNARGSPDRVKGWGGRWGQEGIGKPQPGQRGGHGWAEQACSDQPAPHMQLLPHTALLGKDISPSSLSLALPWGSGMNSLARSAAGGL